MYMKWLIRQLRKAYNFVDKYDDLTKDRYSA